MNAQSGQPVVFSMGQCHLRGSVHVHQPAPLLAQVPYTLGDDELHDDWVCKDNVWDPHHADCSVPQELGDKEIDEIVALQVGAAGGRRSRRRYTMHARFHAD